MAKVATRSKGNETWKGAFLKGGANLWLDSVIESKIKEAFPDASAEFQKDFAIVIETVCSGKVSFGDLAEAKLKDEIREWLAENSPSTAAEYAAADFLYGVYERLHGE